MERSKTKPTTKPTKKTTEPTQVEQVRKEAIGSIDEQLHNLSIPQMSAVLEYVHRLSKDNREKATTNGRPKTIAVIVADMRAQAEQKALEAHLFAARKLREDNAIADEVLRQRDYMKLLKGAKTKRQFNKAADGLIQELRQDGPAAQVARAKLQIWLAVNGSCR